MRVLMISRCPPYPIHLGDRLIIYHLARDLRQHGVQIDLLAFANTPADWQINWADTAPYFNQVTLIPEPRRGAAAYLRRALLPGQRFPQSAAQAWSPAMWQAIQEHRARASYTLAHLFGGVQVYEFWQAVADLPTVIVPYESYSLYLRRMPGLAARIRRRLAQNFESWMFAPYARTVVVSERDRAELLALNPALPVEVISNGVDLDYFQPQNTPREAAALLFTGNYDYAPNVDAALYLATRVLPQVQKFVPSVKLWLVGNAPPPALQALASEAVIVTGRVPDVRPYLARAAVFVSPLRQGAGIKNKVLEALAMGLPVVATPISVDGIHVTHGHDALVADEHHLVQAVLTLLHDEDLRQKLSTNGRVLIYNQYSWARIAGLYAALYASVNESLGKKT